MKFKNMALNFQSKTLCRVCKIIGCLFIWIAYTYIVGQLLQPKMETSNPRKLDFTQEAHEIDQRASVCFKDVIPFSVPLIQGSEICQNKPDLLVIIHTEPDNYKMRFAYREEFISRIRHMATKYDFIIDVVFLMGLNRNYCILTTIVEEIVTYKDILVGSFVDSYYNQTLKSITMLSWFLNNCKSSKLLLKINEHMDPKESLIMDDFYIMIRDIKQNENIITGSFYEVERLNSVNIIPWISVPYLYPGLPQHLHQNYLLSRDSGERLLNAYTDTIYISVWKEDLYITGVLATIAKLKIEHKKHFLIECDTIVCIFCPCDSKISSSKHDVLITETIQKQLNFTDKETHLTPKRDAEVQIIMNSTSTTLTGIDEEEMTSIKINISTRTTSINLRYTVPYTEIYNDFNTVTTESQATEMTTDVSTVTESTTTEYSELISITDIGPFEINEFETGLDNKVYLPADQIAKGNKKNLDERNDLNKNITPNSYPKEYFYSMEPSTKTNGEKEIFTEITT